MRLVPFALFAIPCIAMAVVLHWYLTYPAESGGGLNPELVAVAMPIVIYMILSSIALMIGAIFSWPFRGTLKVHTVAGIILIFLAFMGLITGDPSRRFITGVMLLAGILSTLAARWQDETFQAGQEEGRGPAETRSGPSEGQAEPRTPAIAANGMFPQELTEKYQVMEFVGSGGLARVYRARNLQSGQEVALKIPLQSDEKTGRSFLKEIVGWEGLNHENIVRVSGVNILPVPYVEMEYVPKTLADVHKPLPVRSAARFCRDVARGLLFAHERGIIHRDIKPHNILVTNEGVPKITDWGMSKVMGVTGMPTITGFSLAYAAPEQLAPQTFGETDQRTDIYQIGCVLYELLTGTVPFPGNDMVKVSALILSEVPKRPSILNPDALPLDTIVMRCLEKRPDDRYQNVRDLIGDLDAFLLREDTEDRYHIFED
ncbi:MAG TPA: protein kinase [Methanolinea sp.]|nr:protein kinase [Methanolinea sp.]